MGSKIRSHVISLTVLLGSLFWILDGTLDYFFFYKGSFVGITFTSIPPHELYIRLFWFAGLLIVGVISSRIIKTRDLALKDKQELEELLRSVRNVNQLLVKENDKDTLLQGACDDLYETRGFHHVWIALLDEDGKLVSGSESGLGEKFEPMLELLESGTLPKKVKQVLDKPEVIITRKTPKSCEDCPLAGECKRGTTITRRLEYENQVYGLISACVPEHFVKGEELGLFEEMAADIAFGLHNIKAEEKRKQAEENLRRSEKQFRRAIQLAPFPMMIHAEDGEVVAINERWLGITGYDEEEISTISDWVEKEQSKTGKDLQAHINKLYNLDDRIDEGEALVKTKDGETRIWDFSSAPIGRSTDGRRLVLSMADDVTGRKQAELQAKEERDRAQRYLDIAGSIIVLIDKDRKVREINQKGCEILGYKKEEIIGKDWYENFVPEKAREEVLEDTRKPLMAGDLDKAKRYENPILTSEGEKITIAWENTIIEEDGQIVGTLSSGIDITERMNMEKQIEEDREKLKQSFIQLAETTSRVLGVRDPYTQKHEQRVGELAREVGRRMGLGKEELLGLYLGGILHDIGKITIPETILTKPGELKDVEWQMIKSHPEVGYDKILADTDFPWPVAEMTLHHHERLDGSGYPDGLEGDELTVEVRILGAVDVVEAMSTRRPYRSARSKEETLEEIKKGKGKKYDPEVVEILVDMIEEGAVKFGKEQ